jgi:hypothetical protein
MLFIPAPNGEYQRPEDMPKGMRSPKEYRMNFEDVKITTKDKVNITGWLVKTSY